MWIVTYYDDNETFTHYRCFTRRVDADRFAANAPNANVIRQRRADWWCAMVNEQE